MNEAAGMHEMCWVLYMDFGKRVLARRSCWMRASQIVVPMSVRATIIFVAFDLYLRILPPSVGRRCGYFLAVAVSHEAVSPACYLDVL